jgi:hypothetical protein
MIWPVDPPEPVRRPRRSRVAVALGLPEDTPDNHVVSIAAAMRGNNTLHRIKQDYDANNPPPPPPPQPQVAPAQTGLLKNKKPPGTQSAPTDLGD